jgi:hypothetical protein
MSPSDDQRSEDPSADAAIASPDAPDTPALPPGTAAHPGARAARGSLVPPTPAGARRAAAGLFLALLSLAGLLGLNNLRHGVYVVLYGLLAGAVGLWFAVTSLTAARRDKTARPRGAVAATVIAGVGIVLGMVMLAAFAVLGKQLSSYGQCLSGANTIASHQACQTQFSKAVDHRLASLRPGG